MDLSIIYQVGTQKEGGEGGGVRTNISTLSYNVKILKYIVLLLMCVIFFKCLNYKVYSCTVNVCYFF